VPEPHALIAQKIVEALHAERQRLGWSQETLAVAAGVSNSCIRHLEHQRSTPTLITLLKLASALELDLADLLRAAQKNAEPPSRRIRR
jgi:transcriptional regulator with XRE-family HTH domain